MTWTRSTVYHSGIGVLAAVLIISGILMSGVPLPSAEIACMQKHNIVVSWLDRVSGRYF